MVMDAALMLEAMAIKNDIFEEDILSLRANSEQARDELKFPYQLTQKPGVGERPLFTQERERVARPKQDLLSSEGMLKRPHVSDDEQPRPAKKAHPIESVDEPEPAHCQPVVLDSDDEPGPSNKARRAVVLEDEQPEPAHQPVSDSEPEPKRKAPRTVRHIIEYADSDGKVYPMSVAALDHQFRKVGKQLGWVCKYQAFSKTAQTNRMGQPFQVECLDIHMSGQCRKS